MIPSIALPMPILPMVQPALPVEGVQAEVVSFEALLNSGMANAHPDQPLKPEKEDVWVEEGIVTEYTAPLPQLPVSLQLQVTPQLPVLPVDHPESEPSIEPMKAGAEAPLPRPLRFHPVVSLSQLAHLDACGDVAAPPTGEMPTNVSMPLQVEAFNKQAPLVPVVPAPIKPEAEAVAVKLIASEPVKAANALAETEPSPVAVMERVKPLLTERNSLFRPAHKQFPVSIPDQAAIPAAQPLIAERSDIALPLPVQPAPIASMQSLPQDIAITTELDLTTPDRWLSELVDDVARFEGREGRMLFRLAPEHLGILEVSLTRADDALSVEFNTSNNEAQAIMASSLSRLEQELRQKMPLRIETQLGAQSGQSERQPQTGRPNWTLSDGAIRQSADIEETETNSPAGLFA